MNFYEPAADAPESAQFTSYGRLARRTFLTIAMLKVVVLLTLAGVGRFVPFLGNNAIDHYVPIADRLVAEHRFNGPDSRGDSKVPIGYPMVLAAAKIGTGGRFLLVVTCVQVLADLGVAVLLYGLGVQLSTPAAGALAGAIWLFYPPAVLVSTWITAESLFTLGLLSSLAMLLAALRRSTAGLALAAGVMLGIATMFRGTCLLLPVFLFPLFLFPRWFGAAIPRMTWHGVCFMVGLTCVVLPWRLRNEAVLHDPITVSTGTGGVFLQGSDRRFFTIEGKRMNYPAAYAQAAADGVAAPPPEALESSHDDYMLRVGLDQYRRRLHDRPASFISLAVIKAIRLWYGTETGGWKAQLLLAAMSALIVPLSIWRLIRLWTVHPMAAAVLGGTVSYFVLLHWITLPEYRYVHPVMPLLVLGAADGALRLARGRTAPVRR
jgi:4-amino-4-deoxy-L-arabinose transferase-like glycosyltransferase